MRERIVTKDGSHTIAIPEQRVTYHSIHGAIGESDYVFIEAGLNFILSQFPNQAISIFEMGFGTGLNAFLTAIKAMETKTKIHYTTIEPSPLFVEEAAALNYPETLGHPELFRRLHQVNWNDVTRINEFFTIEKHRISLADFTTGEKFNLVYYDAFAPAAQPELWTREVFEKLFVLLHPGGILVTYCSKGDVKRAIKAAGFTLKKLPGPPGKREMLRAEKLV